MLLNLVFVPGLSPGLGPVLSPGLGPGLSRSWSKSSLGPGLDCIDMKMTLIFCFFKTNYSVNLFF